MCDTSKSGIRNDPQKPYYSKLEEWSALYGYQIGLDGSYGHVFKPDKIKEHVNWDGIVIRDGVRGGSNGYQMKCTKKLCNNGTAKNKARIDTTLPT
eukprot:8199878-Ditylum_brightwellii.AAC.1